MAAPEGVPLGVVVPEEAAVSVGEEVALAVGVRELAAVAVPLPVALRELAADAEAAALTDCVLEAVGLWERTEEGVPVKVWSDVSVLVAVALRERVLAAVLVRVLPAVAVLELVPVSCKRRAAGDAKESNGRRKTKHKGCIALAGLLSCATQAAAYAPNVTAGVAASAWAAGSAHAHLHRHAWTTCLATSTSPLPQRHPLPPRSHLLPRSRLCLTRSRCRAPRPRPPPLPLAARRALPPLTTCWAAALRTLR